MFRRLLLCALLLVYPWRPILENPTWWLADWEAPAVAQLVSAYGHTLGLLGP